MKPLNALEVLLQCEGHHARRVAEARTCARAFEAMAASGLMSEQERPALLRWAELSREDADRADEEHAWLAREPSFSTGALPAESLAALDTARAMVQRVGEIDGLHAAIAYRLPPVKRDEASLEASSASFALGRLTRVVAGLAGRHAATAPEHLCRWVDRLKPLLERAARPIEDYAHARASAWPLAQWLPLSVLARPLQELELQAPYHGQSVHESRLLESLLERGALSADDRAHVDAQLKQNDQAIAHYRTELARLKEEWDRWTAPLPAWLAETLQDLRAHMTTLLEVKRQCYEPTGFIIPETVFHRRSEIGQELEKAARRATDVLRAYESDGPAAFNATWADLCAATRAPLEEAAAIDKRNVANAPLLFSRPAPEEHEEELYWFGLSGVESLQLAAERVADQWWQRRLDEARLSNPDLPEGTRAWMAKQFQPGGYGGRETLRAERELEVARERWLETRRSARPEHRKVLERLTELVEQSVNIPSGHSLIFQALWLALLTGTEDLAEVGPSLEWTFTTRRVLETLRDLSEAEAMKELDAAFEEAHRLEERFRQFGPKLIEFEATRGADPEALA